MSANTDCPERVGNNCTGQKQNATEKRTKTEEQTVATKLPEASLKRPGLDGWRNDKKIAGF